MIRLVIFDCDGVLIDSEAIACAADAEALTGLGYPISTDEVVARFAGVPSAAMYATIEAEIGRSLPPDLKDHVGATILRKYRTELQPIPGAAEVLSALNVPKCVASSAEPTKLALGLVETGLFGLVYPNVFSASLVPRGKPHPDLFLYSTEKMETAIEDCVVIEDSVAGVTAARAAGMRCIGFTGGSHCGPGHDERLRTAGAAHVVGKLAEILPLISS